MMLRDVAAGCGRASGEGIVIYSVEATLIEGRDGVIGCTGNARD